MWTCRDWAVAGTSALGVFGMTVALFWGSPLNAGNEKAPTQQVGVPTYQVGDCSVTAHLVSGDKVPAEAEGTPVGMIQLKPGTMPEVQLVVLNTTDAPAQAAFQVELQHRSMADAMRRVPRPLPPEWSQDYDLSLKPGEKRVITLSFEKVKTSALDTLTLAVGPKRPNVPVSNSTSTARPAFDQTQRIQLLTMAVTGPKPAQAAAKGQAPALASAQNTLR